MRSVLLATCLLAACQDAAGPDAVDTDPTDTPPVGADDTSRTMLTPAQQAVRISMALRGVRPSTDELLAVHHDPAALDALVDAWLDDPGFGQTIRQLYADVLLLRADDARYPPLGTLSRRTIQQMGFALSEEPLALIDRIVIGGRPFTGVVTAPTTVLDSTAARIWTGHDYDPDGPEVQEVRWTDGRPTAGILSTNALWARHVSNGSNAQRGRANLIADALVCEDFLSRDVPITGDIDLSDDDAVAQAISVRPECVSCHQSLDPLGAHTWVFHPEFTPAAVFVSDATGCTTPYLDLCYPFTPYRPELGLLRPLLGLRPPGFYGQPSSDLHTLGQRIADDPRFAQCTVRRFWSFFSQRPLQDTPFSVVASLQQRFVRRGFDAKDLARAVVTHPDFLAIDSTDPLVATHVPGPLLVRPDQHARMIADLTGFSYLLHVDSILSNPVCATTGLACYGDVDLATDDTFGFRSMTGGIDGVRVTHPTHTPTPVKLLFAAALAEESAAWVVKHDVVSDAPRLLTQVDATTVDEPAVRQQLAELHARILGEVVTPDSPEVDDAWALWSAVRGSATDTRTAWRATLAAMLQSPSLLLY